jgi:hypothetical protein
MYVRNHRLEQYRLATRLGQGISEAIAEIQTRRMPAALAENAVCFAGNPRLLLSNRFKDKLCPQKKSSNRRLATGFRLPSMTVAAPT